MTNYFSALLVSFLIFSTVKTRAQDKPVRLAVAGMTHNHVGWILNRAPSDDIVLVGIAEPNKELAMRLFAQHNLDPNLWFADLDEMLEKTKPEAVCAFGSIYEHLEVTEHCAPLGVHVMVEKPLAVNNEHAAKMKELADQHKIHLLTNYETTWYPGFQKIHRLTEEGSIGEIRKIVVHDGHQGPIEIGCTEEFLNWLTDPVLNGGGAIIDFGCYGANLSTLLKDNQKPISVTAVTQQIKPDKYPNVDDEATVILEYEKTQTIIQASWNWPFGRKDMEVYGTLGYLLGPDGNTVISRIGNQQKTSAQLPPLTKPYNDPFAYFASVIRGKTNPEGSLSSLENNMIVVEILSAAVESAKEGKTIYLK